MFVKNMVCDRCVMMLKMALEETGLQPLHVSLGEAEVAVELTADLREELNQRLEKLGFKLINDRKTRLIQNIKHEVIAFIQNPGTAEKKRFSEHLAHRLGQDYSSLSKLFSEVQGVTLEQYIISQKVERVKELLVYEELSVSEIALQLDYSSVSHLSRQFKKVTGLTPTHFKQVKEKKRLPLDQI